MKHITKNAWKNAGLRLLAGFALLVILGSALVSCGGTTTTTIDRCNYNEHNSMSRDKLNALATTIYNTSDTSVSPFTLREIFTAAYLGYDLTGVTSREDDAAGKTPLIPEPEEEPAKQENTDTAGADVAGADAENTATENTATEDTGAEDTATAEDLRKISGSEAMVNAKAAVVLKALEMFNVEKRENYRDLNGYDMESIREGMEASLDIDTGRGFIGSIMYYIGVALRWVTNTIGFGSYIVGLLYFAIVIELLMLPFSIKQQKNSIRQAKLRPKEMAIRNKYKGRNDEVTRRKIQEETQALYQKENFNPLSGCFPLLLQLPIIYILYYVVVDPLQYMLGGSANLSSVLSTFYTTAKAAGGCGGTLTSSRGTIEMLAQIDLSELSGLDNFLYYNPTTCVESTSMLSKIGKDVPNFSIGGLNFGLTPSFNSFNLLLLVPVLTFAVYFLSMKISRKLSYQPAAADDPSAGCSNKMMEYTMPLMSVWISFIVPAVVGIYWIFKSIVGTVKTVILAKVMPLPQFTEEDYKAAERALAGKAPAKRKSGDGTGSTRPAGDRPRSLHHIDDDDDDLPPSGAKARRREAYREEEPEAAPSAEQSGQNEPNEQNASGAQNKKSKREKRKSEEMIDGISLKEDDKPENNTETDR